MGVAIMRSGATDTFARAQYGLFTLALAIGQQYQTVGLYEVRTFHVTDVRRRFDFGTYLSTRLLTCLVMVGLIAYHSWTASTKDPYPAFTVIAAMALLRIFDAFEDVYYSEFQRSGRLDIAGKACFGAHLHHDLPVVGPVLGHPGPAPVHARHLRGHLPRAGRRLRAARAWPLSPAPLV